MQGKTIVATGATSGIGEVAVVALAGLGARIVFIARDEARAQATMRKLEAKAPGLGHRVHLADLSSMAETRKVGEGIAASEPRIDVLINNAGALFSYRRVTQEGLELTFALNHMAYFVLTEALRDRLVASAPARIVSTSSSAHQGMSLDFSDLQSAKSYNGLRVLRPLEARQHPVHPRARPAPGRDRGHRQLPPPRRGRDALRRVQRRCRGRSDPFPPTVLHLAGNGRRHDHLSRVFARGREDDRGVFRQAQGHPTVRGGEGRRGGEAALAREREAGELTPLSSARSGRPSSVAFGATFSQGEKGGRASR